MSDSKGNFVWYDAYPGDRVRAGDCRFPAAPDDYRAKTRNLNL